MWRPEVRVGEAEVLIATGAWAGVGLHVVGGARGRRRDGGEVGVAGNAREGGMLRTPGRFGGGGGGAWGAGIGEWEVRVSQEGEMVVLLGVMGEERGGVLVILVMVQGRAWSVVERL